MCKHCEDMEFIDAPLVNKLIGVAAVVLFIVIAVLALSSCTPKVQSLGKSSCQGNIQFICSGTHCFSVCR